MASAAVDAMLGSQRAFAVAAAGCGKTELLGQVVADERSGRQLVLTHTHAGVAAIKKRLTDMHVPHDKFYLDTIAGWCLRYGAAYPAISGYQPAPKPTRTGPRRTLVPRRFAEPRLGSGSSARATAACLSTSTRTAL